MSQENGPDITTLTVQLLSAFVSNNSVPSENLSDLIRTTRAALTSDPVPSPLEAQAATYVPAVSIRKSLSSPDHILSMIDGRPYKTLKRHLATHGLTPEDYRQRYNLPNSYPLVAPSYSEARRAVATRLGLGRKPVQTQANAAKPEATATQSAPKNMKSDSAERPKVAGKAKSAANLKVSEQPKAATRPKAAVQSKPVSQLKPESNAASTAPDTAKAKAKASRAKTKANALAASPPAGPQN